MTPLHIFLTPRSLLLNRRLPCYHLEQIFCTFATVAGADKVHGDFAFLAISRGSNFNPQSCDI